MRISDWSSDVCSSDLFLGAGQLGDGRRLAGARRRLAGLPARIAPEAEGALALQQATARFGEAEAAVAADVEAEDAGGDPLAEDREIGRASGRGEVCQYG